MAGARQKRAGLEFGRVPKRKPRRRQRDPLFENLRRVSGVVKPLFAAVAGVIPSNLTNRGCRHRSPRVAEHLRCTRSQVTTLVAAAAAVAVGETSTSRVAGQGWGVIRLGDPGQLRLPRCPNGLERLLAQAFLLFRSPRGAGWAMGATWKGESCCRNEIQSISQRRRIQRNALSYDDAAGFSRTQRLGVSWVQIGITVSSSYGKILV